MPGIYSAHDAILGVQSALGGRGSGLRWLLRDEFTTDRAAGAVNGTAAEPGPGGNRKEGIPANYSIASGQLVGVSGSGLNGYHLYDALPIAREAGRLLIAKVTASKDPSCGFVSSTTPIAFPNLKTNIAVSTATLQVSRYDGGSINLGPVTAGQTYMLATLLRASGAFFFIKGGTEYTKWTFLSIQSSDNTATLYAHLVNFTTGVANNWDYIRVPVAKWLPTPLLSDGFGSAFGTSDGLGHAEGLAGGIGAGGSGVTLSNAGGTWSVSGGKAINTAPSGLVQQISVANLAVSDVYAGAAVVRALSTQVGLALNWDSASSPANGVLVYSDGAGNIKIDKYVSGSPSNVSTTAYTYSAGARLVVQKSSTAYRVYYNNALITTQTISDAGIANNTLHGLFSTDASNTLDDLTIYATGTNGEYAALDAWSS